MANDPVRNGRVALIVAMLVALSACGQESHSSGATPPDVDRSDPAGVEVAMVTAFLNLDFDTVRALVLPEQRKTVDDLVTAAELGGNAEVEEVEVDAKLVNRSGDTTIVDYSASYCLPESTADVPVTTVVSDRGGTGTAPGTSLRVDQPRRCFDLGDHFQTEDVQLRLIDGEWFAPLPE